MQRHMLRTQRPVRAALPTAFVAQCGAGAEVDSAGCDAQANNPEGLDKKLSPEDRASRRIAESPLGETESPASVIMRIVGLVHPATFSGCSGSSRSIDWGCSMRSSRSVRKVAWRAVAITCSLANSATRM